MPDRCWEKHKTSIKAALAKSGTEQLETIEAENDYVQGRQNR